MCGIIGIIGKKEVCSMLLEGLKRLEYRGYDSAGIATVFNGQFELTRVQGKVTNLEKEINAYPLKGTTGIAHTRWATHGVPSIRNAHPHQADRVAVVHNGIIENFSELRSELTDLGIEFLTETDTEVVPKMITHYISEGLSALEATKKTIKRLEGAFALAISYADEPDLLVGVRKGAPLAVGFGDGEMYLGSDSFALSHLTDKISYMEDGDWVILSQESCQIFNKHGEIANREVRLSELTGAYVGKDNFPHFMLKEIYEQPSIIGDTLNAYIDQVDKTINLPDFNFDLSEISKITIVACGTSYYSGMVARYWFEQIAKIPVEIDIASEFRYREAILPEKGLAIFISQSGETADTLAALREAKKKGQYCLGLVNVKGSTIARESDGCLLTMAGPEIGVASTKAFTAQLTSLACLVLKTALVKKTITEEEAGKYIYSLLEVPSRISEILNRNKEIEDLANIIKAYPNILYMGRGTNYPVAQEGALKLKELSYIHAEALAAGELKHGTIALIDENMPIITMAPNDTLFGKTASNAQEVAARGGKIILFSDEDGINQLAHLAFKSFKMPRMDSFITPLIYAIPVQLLAYHVAHKLGKDIDQPRNLAKSVTVE